MFVLGDGTRLFSSVHTIIHIAPSVRLSTTLPGTPIFDRFNCPTDMTVDRTDNVVVVDYCNHVIRSVTK
jgi:hypothetical protein